jgi:hypothetical protein
VDEEREQILAIGGNVRGTVGLKLLPAERVRGRLRPIDRSAVPDARSHFVHLQLRAAPIATDAFDSSATLSALACVQGVPGEVWALQAAAASAGVASAQNC